MFTPVRFRPAGGWVVPAGWPCPLKSRMFGLMSRECGYCKGDGYSGVLLGDPPTPAVRCHEIEVSIRGGWGWKISSSVRRRYGPV